jgi:hypothetical protein
VTRVVVLALLLASCGDDVTAPVDMSVRAIVDLTSPPPLLDVASSPDLGPVERCLYLGYGRAKCSTGRARECVLTAIECGDEGGRCCVAGGCWSDEAWCDLTDFVCKRC